MNKPRTVVWLVLCWAYILFGSCIAGATLFVPLIFFLIYPQLPYWVMFVVLAAPVLYAVRKEKVPDTVEEPDHWILKKIVKPLAEQRGIVCPELVILHGDGHYLIGVAYGLFSGARIALSDQFLKQVSIPVLRFAVAHELCHIRSPDSVFIIFLRLLYGAVRWFFAVSGVLLVWRSSEPGTIFSDLVFMAVCIELLFRVGVSLAGCAVEFKTDAMALCDLDSLGWVDGQEIEMTMRKLGRGRLLWSEVFLSEICPIRIFRTHPYSGERVNAIRWVLSKGK